MSKKKKCTNKINSIQYIHDPDAAKEWMDLFMELTKKHYLQHVSRGETE